jgi:hypothetical protein
MEQKSDIWIEEDLISLWDSDQQMPSDAIELNVLKLGAEVDQNPK